MGAFVLRPGRFGSVFHRSLSIGSPEPAVPPVDRGTALDHAEPPCHRQEGQHRSRQPDQLLHGCFARQPRQRHQQPAGRHRQRRAGAAGCQHRHLLAAEARRQRQVGRQPGPADPVGYSTKSSVTSAAITGATANNLLGNIASATVRRRAQRRTARHAGCRSRRATLLSGGAQHRTRSSNDFTAADTIVVNGMTINFNSGGGTTGSATAGTLDLDVTDQRRRRPARGDRCDHRRERLDRRRDWRGHSSTPARRRICVITRHAALAARPDGRHLSRRYHRQLPSTARR